MQENTNIFEKLNSHSLPVDNSYWAEMEERLQQKPRKTFWWWFSGASVAAASMALFITLNLKSGAPIEQISISENSVNHSEINAQPQPCNEQARQRQTSNEYEKVDNAKLNIPAKAAMTNSLKNLSGKGEHTQQKSVLPAYEEIAENASVDTVYVNLKYNTISEKQKVAPSPSSVKMYELATLPSATLNKEKIQDNNSWFIAAAMSAGAANSSNNGFSNKEFSNKEFSTNSSSQNSAPNFSADYIGGDRMIAEHNDPSIDDIFYQFPEVTHLPPLSVGLNVRKKIAKHVAIETGVNYTFLQSKFKDNNEWQPRNATLKLHYIGVPLNVVVYVLNKPQWNVYVSLGEMLEKGLRLNYNQTTINQYWYGGDKPVHNISLQDKISGVQWSLNTAFGVDYTIYRCIGLYFEPRIIYYFENNQPVSVRSETPLSVGLNAGIRFEF